MLLLLRGRCCPALPLPAPRRRARPGPAPPPPLNRYIVDIRQADIILPAPLHSQQRYANGAARPPSPAAVATHGKMRTAAPRIAATRTPRPSPAAEEGGGACARLARPPSSLPPGSLCVCICICGASTGLQRPREALGVVVHHEGTWGRPPWPRGPPRALRARPPEPPGSGEGVAGVGQAQPFGGRARHPPDRPRLPRSPAVDPSDILRAPPPEKPHPPALANRKRPTVMSQPCQTSEE